MTRIYVTLFFCIIVLFGTYWILRSDVISHRFPAELSWLLYLAGVFALAAILFLIWKPWRKKWKLYPALVPVALFVLTIGGLIGYRIYDKSILQIPITQINLSEYTPFAENNRLAVLPEAADLQFDDADTLPRMDGATALYPLYAAFAQAVYPPDGNYKYASSDLVTCTRTDQAFHNLLNGSADIVFLNDVSAAMHARAEAAALQLQITPIGKGAFVFFVNARNPVSDLSTEQIKKIYSGSVTNWNEVGGKRREIRAFQRNAESGSQIALVKMMGDTPIMPAPEEWVHGIMADVLVVADYKNHKNAIGYSFRYYLMNMTRGGEIKLLSIDGIAPTVENIANGSYPLADTFYVVTVAREPRNEAERLRAENTQKLLEWILSEQGQYLVGMSGYVPL
ncbi:MAG: substrate-binding domain-containing protein [Clostridiales bacterium]|nr:substrate-binding domain-containing protein [Clostridiales bacterium]